MPVVRANRRSRGMTLSGDNLAANQGHAANRGWNDIKTLVRSQSARRARRASIGVDGLTEEQAFAFQRWQQIQNAMDAAGQPGAARDAGRTAEEEVAEVEQQHTLRAKMQAQRARARFLPKCCLRRCSGGEAGVQASADTKRAEAGGACHNGMVHPNSDARRTWDCVVIFGLAYCAVIVPYRLGFDTNPEGAVRWLEAFIDVTFLLDLVLIFRTGYAEDAFDEDSRIEMRPKLVARRYLKGWFIVDLSAAFPTQLISLLTNGDGVSKTVAASRLPRLLRIPRMLRMLRVVQLMRVTTLCRGGLEMFGLSRTVMRGTRLAIITLALSHFVCCCWFGTHTLGSVDFASGRTIPESKTWWWTYCGHVNWWDELSDEQQGVHRAWLAVVAENGEGGAGAEPLSLRGLPEPASCNWSLEYKYMVSIYWATTTLTTMGYGDIVPVATAELWFTTVMMLLGVSFYAYIASTFLLVLASANAQKKSQKENMERLAEFTSQRNISFALRNRLWRYFRVYWTENVSTNTRASGAIKHGKGDAGHGSSEENEDEDEEQDEAMIEKHVRDFLHGSWDTVTEATTGMEDVITASPWHQEQEEGRARHGGAVLSDKRRRSEGATSWRAEMLKDSNRAATRGNKLMRMGGVTHASHVLSDADVVNAITLPGLRADVTAELFREITRSVPFLHAKDLGFLEAVAPWMELMRVQPDDLIIHEGERGQEAGMFFVLSGTIVAEFEDDDGTKHAVAAYGAGQYFGVEAMQSILGEPVIERHLLSSRCEDECSLYGLGEASLRHAIEMGYVDVKKELHLEATIRLKHVLNFVQKLPTTTASSKSIRTDSANRYLAGESEDA